MHRLWAIDPGGFDSKQKTTGWAEFAYGECVASVSMHAGTVLAALMTIEDPPVIVYESYATFPGAKGVTRSEHPTAQTIGAIKFIAGYRGLTLHAQQPSIKPAGAMRMERAGISHIGKNQHARDAEMHGWYWLLTHGGTQ